MEVVALGVLLFVSLRTFTDHVDLHVTDETAYLIRGQHLLDGKGKIEHAIWSPLYSVGLASIPGDSPIDVMFAAVTVAATFALWWALRGLLGAGGAAFLATIWFATSDSALGSLQAPRCGVYLFTSAIVFMAIGLFTRRRGCSALIALLIAGLTRFELVPWVGFVALVLLLGPSARANLTKPEHGRALKRIAIVGLLLLIGQAGLVVGTDEGRARRWLNFSQHYVWGQHDARDTSDLTYDLSNASATTRKTFPDAESVIDAARINPDAFWDHVRSSAEILPETLISAAGTPFRHVGDYPAAIIITPLLVLGFLVAVRSRRPQIPRGAWVVITTLLILPLLMVLRPREEILLPVLPLILGASAALCRSGVWFLCDCFCWRPPMSIPVVLVLLAAFLAPKAFPTGGARALPFREAVDLIRTLPAGRRVIGSYAKQLRTLAGRPGPSLHLGIAPAPQPADAQPGDCLVMTTYDLVAGDPVRTAWKADLTPDRWRLVHGGLTAWLLERK